MSIKLFIVLVVLMAANQVLGTCYGSWKEGFSKALLWTGLKKIFFLAIGYGALAFAARYAAQYVPSAEYLSGILVEPIAKYFSKICESLRGLLNDSVSENVAKRKQNGDSQNT